jgi:hypothetical protein
VQRLIRAARRVSAYFNPNKLHTEEGTQGLAAPDGSIREYGVPIWVLLFANDLVRRLAWPRSVCLKSAGENAPGSVVFQHKYLARSRPSIARNEQPGLSRYSRRKKIKSVCEVSRGY